MLNPRNNLKVDDFIRNTTQWQVEFQKLRQIIQSFDLDEDLKWGVPCYTYNDKNVLLIHGFKAYCAILFIKGALLYDETHCLIQQTANVQAGRQLRFKNTQEIIEQESMIREFITQAIVIEQKGLNIDFKTTKNYSIPTELQEEFDTIADLKSAFYKLTPGRQRAYLLYFNAPKQTITRTKRIKNAVPMILQGKGLYDN
ncbi:hypothetical protein SDC9_166355 [bioreactor metagenome]|uniref:YdhG-like domain-containing protein n=1 Tax=bioreactor metagenome TaxID=1076179 RepID=A0A645FZB8_9ZZZZ|nr:DUF1801 domain-containing protein [Erysipelotrichaceae bacterium]